MFVTDPEDPRTEAEQVAEREARNGPQPVGYRRSRPRLSLHINWDERDEAEMLFCEAFRLLPRGMSRRVILNFLHTLVGDCRDKPEVVRVLHAWSKAQGAEARAALTGGAPDAWLQVPQMRSSREQAAAQVPMRQRDFVRSMREAPAPPGYRWDLVAHREPQAPARPEPVWMSGEARGLGERPPAALPRARPEPAEMPPPRRMPEQQVGWSLDGF